jgi:hypothetical protein
MTISGKYPTESIFAFRKPSVGRSVGNNPFRFHSYHAQGLLLGDEEE